MRFDRQAIRDVITVANRLGSVRDLPAEECQALLAQHEARMGRS